MATTSIATTAATAATAATAQPTGNGSPDDWTYALAGAATKYEACQTPDDDDSSYIESGAVNGQRQTFTAAPSGIATGDIVTQVDIIARWKQAASNPPSGRIGYAFDIHGGGSQSGTSPTVSGITTSYQSDTYTVSGLSVAWGGNLTFFAECALSRRIRLTSLTAVITYTPAAPAHAVSKTATVRLASKLQGLV
jgi:hypothetical protein